MDTGSVVVPSKFSCEAKCMCLFDFTSSNQYQYYSYVSYTHMFISRSVFSVAAGCFPPSSTTQALPPNKTAVSMNSQTIVIIASVTAVIFLVICIVLAVVFVVR